MLTDKWSSTAVTYSTTAPPLSTSTTDVMTHAPQSVDPQWQTPGLQPDSTKRQKTWSGTKMIKKWTPLQRNNNSQTFMNLICRAKATCSPVLSVWFNRKLTLAKKPNTKTGSLSVKHWRHGNSQLAFVCGAEMNYYSWKIFPVLLNTPS